MKKALFCSLFSLCSVCIMGCKVDDPTVWREEFRSPDGAWVAIAHTEQYGGPGTAWVGTEVDLQRIDERYIQGRVFNVLALEPSGIIPATYKLSIANRGGGAALKVHWADPHHLELSFDGTSKVNLQVVRHGDVTVTLFNAATGRTDVGLESTNQP